MLAIRLQRTGRSGHAQFRIIVQDAHRSPMSGNIVAYIGHFNPHTKVVVVDKEKANFYLSNGAQPTTRISRLLGQEGVTIPAWAEAAMVRKYKIRNPEKLRRNRPAGTPPPAPVAEEAVTGDADSTATETPLETAEVEAVADTASVEKPSETPVTTDTVPEAPAAEPALEAAETTDAKPAAREDAEEQTIAQDDPVEAAEVEPAAAVDDKVNEATKPEAETAKKPTTSKKETGNKKQDTKTK